MRRRTFTAGLAAAVPTMLMLGSARAEARPTGATARSAAAVSLDGAVEAPAGSIAMYRFWSPVYRGHFYTTDAYERDQLRLRSPNLWEYEGQVYRAWGTQVAGSVPLHRFWSAAFTGHFYTVSEEEKQHVIDAYDDRTWSYEGVSCYVLPSDVAVTGANPVSRFWSDTYRHHFYTADANEAEVTKGYPAAIWRFEAVPFSVLPAVPDSSDWTPVVPLSDNPFGTWRNGRIPAEYLVDVQNGMMLRTDVAAAWWRMKAAAASAGVVLGIAGPGGAYRDIALQGAMQRDPGSYGVVKDPATGRYPAIADPGQSTHGWATCVDIVSKAANDGWAAAHANEFGFVRDRYPRYAFESNHWHYVENSTPLPR